MPNSTVPASATALPDVPRPSVQFQVADDFTGPAGQLLAAALACQAARRLEALDQPSSVEAHANE